MALMDVIRHRRSIRSYRDKPVEREKILACLEAARLAPSATNSQPWYFIVVDDAELKDRLCNEAFSGFFSNMQFPRQAPVIIVAVNNLPDIGHRAGYAFLRRDYSLVDMGIATEHLVLRADELGLGTCWIGLFDEEKVKKVLGIPRDRRISVLLTLGYYDEAPAGHEQRRKPLDEIYNWNGWEKRVE